jgi:hypothetical protein
MQDGSINLKRKNKRLAHILACLILETKNVEFYLLGYNAV